MSRTVEKRSSVPIKSGLRCETHRSTYFYIRLAVRFLRALHLSIIEQPYKWKFDSRNVAIYIFFVTIFVMLICSQSMAVENLKSKNFSLKKPYIIDIAVDAADTAFFLDNTGHVWAYQKPLSRQGLIRLPNLKNIKKIAPWIALDKDGRVFTWFFDKATHMLEEGELVAIYSRPKLFPELGNITMIAFNNADSFVAVRENRDILEWSELPKGRVGIIGRTPVKKLCTREGVRAIAAYLDSTMALFNDGLILGWGVNEVGQIRKDMVDRQVSFKVPGAVAVYLNGFHIAVLLEDGRTIFWGGCGNDDKYYTEPLGLLPTDGIVKGINGSVTDVIDLSMTGNDNRDPNVFLKRDGTIWRAYAPLPPGIKKRNCMSDHNGKSWQISGMSVPAIAVKTNSIGGVWAIGIDHTVWWSGIYNQSYQKFTQIKVKPNAAPIR